MRRLTTLPPAPGATGSHLPFLAVAAVVAGGAEQPEIAHLVGAAVPHLAEVVHGVPRSPAERAKAAIARDHQPSDLLPGAGVIAPVCRIAVLGRRPPTQGAMLWRAMRHDHSTMQADCDGTIMPDLRVMHERAK